MDCHCSLPPVLCSTNCSTTKKLTVSCPEACRPQTNQVVTYPATVSLIFKNLPLKATRSSDLLSITCLGSLLCVLCERLHFPSSQPGTVWESGAKIGLITVKTLFTFFTLILSWAYSGVFQRSMLFNTRTDWREKLWENPAVFYYIRHERFAKMYQSFSLIFCFCFGE